MKTIIEYWRNSVARFPRKPAALYQGKQCSYARADRLTRSLAKALREEFGLQRGQAVAVAMPNCIEYFLAYWAIVRAGGIVAAVNTRLGPEEMAYVVGDTAASILLTHGRVKRAVAAGLDGADDVQHVIVAEGGDGLALEDLLVGSDDFSDLEVGSGDPAVVAYTSGTTGEPKGAVMRQCDLTFNVKMCLVAHSFRHEDVHMLALPMFHCTAQYSLLPASAYLGSALAIAPRPDKHELLDLIETAKVTTFLGPPALFAILTMGDNLAGRDTSSLRYVGYAGSPMHPDTIRRLRRLLPHVELRNFFGLTETTSVTHVLPSAHALSHADSVGKPLPEVRAIITDPDGKPMPPGETGELCFHRNNVIGAYWHQPGKLEESFRGDWFRTGDLAHMDQDGYLYVHGREKDVIIVGGENVIASEVESVIAELDGVHEVAVVGLQATGIRAYLGELVKAVVVCRPGHDLTERDLKRHCISRLASYQVPQIIEFRDQLPRNPAGKVLKRELK